MPTRSRPGLGQKAPDAGQCRSRRPRRTAATSAGGQALRWPRPAYPPPRRPRPSVPPIPAGASPCGFELGRLHGPGQQVGCRAAPRPRSQGHERSVPLPTSYRPKPVREHPPGRSTARSGGRPAAPVAHATSTRSLTTTRLDCSRSSLKEAPEEPYEDAGVQVRLADLDQVGAAVERPGNLRQSGGRATPPRWTPVPPDQSGPSGDDSHPRPGVASALVLRGRRHPRRRAMIAPSSAERNPDVHQAKPGDGAAHVVVGDDELHGRHQVGEVVPLPEARPGNRVPAAARSRAAARPAGAGETET